MTVLKHVLVLCVQLVLTIIVGIALFLIGDPQPEEKRMTARQEIVTLIVFIAIVVLGIFASGLR